LLSAFSCFTILSTEIRLKAIIKTKFGPQLRELPRPEIIESTDVLVRVKAASICRTDLFAAYGQISVKEGRILGHEFTGIIEELGDSVQDFTIGDRVVGNPFLPCGRCADCASSNQHRCLDGVFIGVDRDGAFAEYIVISENSLSHLPRGVTFPVGTYVEPVAAGLAIFEAPLRKSEQVLVIGEGRICRLTVALLKDAGFNAVYSVRLPDVNTLEEKFDVVIESVELNDQVEAVLSILKTRGLLLIKSRNPTVLTLPLLELIRKQIRIHAVKYAPFQDAIRYVSQHREDLSASLNTAWTLDDFESAFAASKQSEEYKICFSFAG
jgi:threonine dehydrogenase-like Zn-dependent dehydrogenase